ncbi:MAG: sensor histidine kinase [Dorea sp.]|nr:sensor histidine kinase [Dorea sp.]
MVGKRRQEIGKYILVFLAAWLCITAAFFAYAIRQETRMRLKVSELISLYPEMEEDLIRIMEKEAVNDGREHSEQSKEQSAKTDEVQRRLEETYGYTYGKCVKESSIWNLYGICILCTGAFFVILWTLSGRKGTKGISYYERLEKFGRMLEEFSRGNDTVPETEYNEFRIPDRAAEDANAKEAELWLKIEEALLELGGYLQDKRHRYEEEEEATKALITNISHQLKTPLASLRMSHELASREDLSEEERNEFILQEEREIKTLQQLLDEMIKLSRLEKHMIQLQPEIGSLCDTISDAVSVIYPKAAAKSMTVQAELPEEISILHDARWTAEALANILDNAVKYAPEKTRIIIQVQKLTNHILIEVIDEGPGILEKEKHKIYQRFYRGVQAEKTEGAGVGLYLARQILEEQKGSILVKNNYPRGSNFQILLPL